MDLDDGVIDVDHHMVADPGHHRGPRSQPGQKPAGHRVELADAAEGERRRNEPNVEGGAYAPLKTLPIPP